MPVVLYKWGGHSGLPSLTAASLQAEVGWSSWILLMLISTCCNAALNHTFEK
jgi:hypothetical protein